MKIGLCAKSNTGKSTFFSAATLVDVEISNRIFTTIKPNTGVAYVTAPCACKDLNIKCNPQNSKCVNGTRLIPVTLVDVAGLVPDAHLGKGLGNQFLSEIMEAEAIIHIVDLSGTTDSSGNPCPKGHDPAQDIKALENEIDFWIHGILEKNWANIEKKAQNKNELNSLVYKQISGLGIDEGTVAGIVKQGYESLLDLATKIRKQNKPILLAGNKIDLQEARANYEQLKAKYKLIPTSADSELALCRAAKSSFVEYSPGANDFEITEKASGTQKKALEAIKDNVFKQFKGTGVQQAINELVFEKLDYIVVYPVEDKNKLSDKKGNVLPDAHLMKNGSTVFDVAQRVHTEIAEKFKGAIDVRTGKKLGKDHVLQNNDVVQILV
jgi:ribosome-binding ATPase YchF (GTP1/OBG family)